ncbi:MAG TPA: VOC family protein [Bacteroidia bacterium]|nr:VOC family protein [Bacteroidia bacterium]
MIKEANLTIMVKDLDRSISFYQSIGFSLKQRWTDHYALLAVPGILLGLHPANGKHEQGSGNTSIGLTTHDVKAAKALLMRLSIEVQSRQEEAGEFLHFNDPDGTQLYFIKPKWQG